MLLPGGASGTAEKAETSGSQMINPGDNGTIMLAFVFWHWPFPDVGPRRYERSLVKFHESLAKAKPEGFCGSFTFRIEGAPWLTDWEHSYQDVYLLEGSVALDRLNAASVGEISGEVHDVVAREAAGGTGGLYQLREGQVDVPRASCGIWLPKLRSTSYKDFYSQLQPWTEQPGVSLWRRHLVLGPTPEFCLMGPAELKPPQLEGVVSTKLDLIWPKPTGRR